MELQVNSINNVYLDAEPNWTATATWSLNGSTPAVLPVSGPVAGRLVGTLPYLPTEGEVEIVWTLNVIGSGTFNRTDYYQVITPYLSIRDIMRDCEVTDVEEAVQIEASTRYVINAHTGQSFGRSIATRRVRGTGENTLALPARLLSVTKFNGEANAGGLFDVVGDGWYLRINTWGVPSVRADFYGLHMHRGGVIHNPNNVRPNVFASTMVYEIEGEWGWKFIPAEVKEAARIIANDIASGDNIYRDRYLTSMTAADWRIQFNSGAFAKTGNARADHLLSNYVLTRGWAVI